MGRVAPVEGQSSIFWLLLNSLLGRALLHRPGRPISPTTGSNFLLQTLDLFADSLDLIVFLRTLKRVAITGYGSVRFTRFLVSVAEVFDDRGIVPGNFYGPFQLLYGFRIVSLLTVNASQGS